MINIEPDHYYITESGHKAYIEAVSLLDGTDEEVLVGTVYDFMIKEKEFETIWELDGKHHVLTDLFLTGPWKEPYSCTCGAKAVGSPKHAHYCDVLK